MRVQNGFTGSLFLETVAPPFVFGSGFGRYCRHTRALHYCAARVSSGGVRHVPPACAPVCGVAACALAAAALAAAPVTMRTHPASESASGRQSLRQAAGYLVRARLAAFGGTPTTL